MNKKKLFLWCLYTVANSVVFINFLVYFSKWLVVDGGVSDLAYNMVFVTTAILLLFSAPALAAHNDDAGHRKLFLNISTIGIAAAYFLAAISATTGAPATLSFLFFLAGQYCYQLSFSFYDPLLNDVADEKHRAAASGLGQFCSSFGMVLGLAISLPLAHSGRLAPLIPSVIIFLILALPMMIWYRESRTTNYEPRATIKLGFDGKKFLYFMRTSAAAPVLVAFFFYNDALATITNNYSIYAARVVGMSDATTSIMLMVVMIAGAIGALLSGFFGDRLGIKRCLKIILWTWFLLIPVMALANDMRTFFALATLLGLATGAGWATSRAYISLCLDDDNLGYGFSFYTIFERFSSIMGPLAWGAILTAGGTYRLAMMSMSIFVAIGLIILGLTKRQPA